MRSFGIFFKNRTHQSPRYSRVLKVHAGTSYLAVGTLATLLFFAQIVSNISIAEKACISAVQGKKGLLYLNDTIPGNFLSP